MCCYVLWCMWFCSFFFLLLLYFVGCLFFFFFSSRRRHTRYIGDWSSDVCSSDLGPKSIGIVSSAANLAPHVGHKIEVTGTAVPVKEAEDMKPAPPKAPHYMKLTDRKSVV